MIILAWLTLLAITAFLPAEALAEQILLRQRLSAGQEYFVETVWENFPAFQPPDAWQVGWREYHITVDEVDEHGNALITVSLLRIISDSNPNPAVPGLRLFHDSADPPAIDDPMWHGDPFFDAAIGKRVTFELAPNGALQYLTGMENIVHDALALIDKIPSRRLDDEAKARDKTGLESVALRNLATRLVPLGGFIFYKEEGIEVGDTWTEVNNFGGPVKIQHRRVYTLARREEGIAVIEVATSNQDEKKTNFTKGKETFEVDEETGWVVRWHSDSESHTTRVPGQTLLVGSNRFSRGPLGESEEPSIESPSTMISP